MILHGDPTRWSYKVILQDDRVESQEIALKLAVYSVRRQVNVLIWRLSLSGVDKRSESNHFSIKTWIEAF